jgi:hypothetical protein
VERNQQTYSIGPGTITVCNRISLKRYMPVGTACFLLEKDS